MNWSDMAVIVIILGFAITGMINGFVMSVFRLMSFFLSIYISIKFYPIVSSLLMTTPLFDNIKKSVSERLFMQHAESAVSRMGQAAADNVVNSLHLPGFMKEGIMDRLGNVSGIFDISGVFDVISGEIAKIIINFISLILVYLAAKLILFFFRFVFQGISKLPLFRQMDKLGGFAFGAVEGLLSVYILFALLILFHSVPQLEPAFKAIDDSLFASFFYNNNFIIEMLLN